MIVPWFMWTASSMVEEIERERPALLPRLKVIDFNPETVAKLRARGIAVIYGDVSQRDVLEHAGIGEASVIVCSLSDSVLRGASNLRMLRQLRSLTERAEIIVHAERLDDAAGLYAAGASYVVTPRLLEARELLDVLDAVDNHLIAEKTCEQLARLENRSEVIP